jgi:hypothetical protein
VIIYEAFVEDKLEAPKHLARMVHDLYFEPQYEDFRPRTIWSLSKAFTSTFKELEPIPQFKATASWESSWNLGSRNRSNLAGKRRAGHAARNSEAFALRKQPMPALRIWPMGISLLTAPS